MSAIQIVRFRMSSNPSIACWLPLARQQDVFRRALAARDGQVGIDATSERPRLQRGGLERTHLEAWAQLAHDPGDVRAAVLGGVDAEKSLTIVIEVHQVELDASLADAGDGDLSAV